MGYSCIVQLKLSRRGAYRRRGHNLATMGSAPYHASSAYISNPWEGNFDPCLLLAIIYCEKCETPCVSKKLCMPKHVCIKMYVFTFFFFHATLNAKASLWLVLHTAHPACARLTPNTERINHRTNIVIIPYIWIFWSYTSRDYERARHAGTKWRGEIDPPW